MRKRAAHWKTEPAAGGRGTSTNSGAQDCADFRRLRCTTWTSPPLWRPQAACQTPSSPARTSWTAEATTVPSLSWRLSTWPLPVVMRRSPAPTKAREAFLEPCSGKRISPMGSQESLSCAKSSTSPGSLSSTIAACSAPSSSAAAAARRCVPSATGRAPGRPWAEAGPQDQAAPAAGRRPGHESKWPALDTKRRPSLSAAKRPHEAPTSGGNAVRPESLKDSAAEAAAPPAASGATAPKPRGVNAATWPSAPQASSCGSKKPGQDTLCLTPLRAAPSPAAGIDSRSAFMASKKPALESFASAPSERRRPSGTLWRLYSSAWRFSSCHAICSGMKGLAPAPHGKPSGMPSSCGASERRVIGGRDQCGAVTSACSPMATSTMVPKMSQTQQTGSTALIRATIFQGCTVSASAKAGVVAWVWRSSVP
mmetsp:Transcript_154032/g.493769  ORF Transcript_154032/g.493769 Transcript_154032/m.493769 type:complete len:424 (-) Transcript_154032:1473-2744(-)